MVLQKDALRQGIGSKRKLLAAAALGGVCLVVALIFMAVDPFVLMVNHNLRLANGSVFCELLAQGLEGGKFTVYLFNITNAEDFLSGQDHKLKVEEVGPFTYREYRTTENFEFNPEAGVMKYTPHYKPHFVEEESIGRPEDVHLTLPNMPMLSATSMMSSKHSFVRNMFNIMANQLGSKAIVKMDVHNYLWGYEEPLITLANKIVPGMIYFKTIGIMDRMYDREIDYRLELGTTDEDRFSIKSMTKYRRDKMWDSEEFDDDTTNFTDTYEGMGYRTGLTTETPINIYRPGVCRLFSLQYSDKGISTYGSDAYIYKFRDNMFSDETKCSRKGACPNGTLDMSPCVFGLPLAMSKGHFLGGDPKLYDKIDGLNPDENIHDSYFLIDPKISLTLETSMSLQVNIVIGDVRFNREAKSFSDMVVPIAHVKVQQPNLPKQADDALRLTYVYGTSIMIGTKILLLFIGFALLGYSVRLFCVNRLHSNGKSIELFYVTENSTKTLDIKAQSPLMKVDSFKLDLR